MVFSKSQDKDLPFNFFHQHCPTATAVYMARFQNNEAPTCTVCTRTLCTQPRHARVDSLKQLHSAFYV